MDTSYVRRNDLQRQHSSRRLREQQMQYSRDLQQRQHRRLLQQQGSRSSTRPPVMTVFLMLIVVGLICGVFYFSWQQADSSLNNQVQNQQQQFCAPLRQSGANAHAASAAGC